MPLSVSVAYMKLYFHTASYPDVELIIIIILSEGKRQEMRSFQAVYSCRKQASPVSLLNIFTVWFYFL